jgi:glycosyltransferase involved in cell wall biosynthesis
MNSANKDPYRKDFPRALTALQIFLQNNPDAQKDTRMYIHSWMRQSRDIPHCAKVLYVDQYCRGTADYHNLCGVPPQILNEIYNAGDVFLHTSQGGGFEIPLLEASSAGVPSIAQDFVGFKELIRDHGWLIKPKTKYFTQLDGLQAIADEYEIADAIEDAYNHLDKRKKMGNKARKFALNFKWSIINREWHKVFDEIIDEISYKPLSVRQL